MKKIEFIKTRLYFIAGILALTALCIVLYTFMKSDESAEDLRPELALGQDTATENTAPDLQQVSSIPRQERSGGSRQGTDDADDGADASAVQEAKEPARTTYILVVTDGCLQVYLAETGVLYMETAIEYDLLPENVKEQIDAGKTFESEGALLEFLENYSS